MIIRRFNREGIEAFTRFIGGAKGGRGMSVPHEVLCGENFTEEVGGDTLILDELNLESALETAKLFDRIIQELELRSVERDTGFWAWCSAYLFDRLCKRKNGVYAPGELPIWVPEPNNWKRYYRHYLASIWRVYAAHPPMEQELNVLLGRPVNIPGELYGQIAATQALVTNPAMLGAVYKMFWDEGEQKRKTGSGGGSARRLTAVLKQFGKTYDFVAMSSDQILDLLPWEFDRFKA